MHKIRTEIGGTLIRETYGPEPDAVRDGSDMSDAQNQCNALDTGSVKLRGPNTSPIGGKIGAVAVWLLLNLHDNIRHAPFTVR